MRRAGILPRAFAEYGLPPPHVALAVDESRNLHKLVKEQDHEGAAGIVQGEAALAHLSEGYDHERDPYGEGSFPKPYLPAEEGET